MKKMLLLSLVLLAACSKDTRLQKIFTDANLVKVYVYGGGTVPIVHYETNDIDKIKGWKNYISENNATLGNCNMEGRLVFKFADDSTAMKFSLRQGCQYVTYSAGDSTFNKQLTPEGINFIQGLMKVQ